MATLWNNTATETGGHKPSRCYDSFFLKQTGFSSGCLPYFTLKRISPYTGKGQTSLDVNRSSLSQWSVIACDQHSAEPEYWDALDSFVGSAPSTLRMMLPEAYLAKDIEKESKAIHRVMQEYLESGVFTEVRDSYIYVERSLPSGVVRRGLVGLVDLDLYDYSRDSVSPIRATEGTVEERLPARVRIRSGAPLEMPHIMIFINDPKDCVFNSVEPGPVLYDFELNCGGGHLVGRQITGSAADRIDQAFQQLTDDANAQYRDSAPVVLAMGDGNHSLATAKKCGDRYALAEIVNINDESIVFEPIHRVLFGADTADFIRQFGTQVVRMEQNEGEGYAALIERTDRFLRDYLAVHGGTVDYIHNDDAAMEMGSRENCAAILLPALDKTTLFDSIVRDGPYPKKSFSIGHAAEKRYYLECRKLGR